MWTSPRWRAFNLMALQSDSSSEHRFTCHSIKRCSNIMNNWFDVAVNLSTYISGFVWVSGRYCQGKFEKPTPIQAIRLRSLRSSVFWDTRINHRKHGHLVIRCHLVSVLKACTWPLIMQFPSCNTSRCIWTICSKRPSFFCAMLQQCSQYRKDIEHVCYWCRHHFLWGRVTCAALQRDLVALVLVVFVFYLHFWTGWTQAVCRRAIDPTDRSSWSCPEKHKTHCQCSVLRPSTQVDWKKMETAWNCKLHLPKDW